MRSCGARERWCPALLSLSVLGLLVTGALGTSAAVPPLRAGERVGPSPWLVTALLAGSVVCGTGGLLRGLRALRAGWEPAPRRLLAAGVLAVLAMLVVPPMGTADLGSYAAYGRLATLGRDPYVTRPDALPRDPVVSAAEDPWRDMPSVYGPVATAEQRLAAQLGRGSRAATLRLLAAAAGLAFLASGVLLDRLCRGDAARRRAALLWTANPLLLLQLVGGAHVDGLLALLALAGVAVAARPGRSGALLGLAGAVKATALLPALGLALARRRRPGWLAAYAVAGIAVVVGAYALGGGWHALTPARRAGRMVSRGTPWRWVASGLERLTAFDTARSLTVALAVLVALGLGRRLSSRLPNGLAAARAAAVPTLAWLLVAPYALPWYDATGWVLLALLAASAYDTLLAVHTGLLSLAYLPGRVLPLPAGLVDLQTGTRSILAPLMVLAVLGLAWRVRPGNVGGPA